MSLKRCPPPVEALLFISFLNFITLVITLTDKQYPARICIIFLIFLAPVLGGCSVLEW